jgi:hypothetical protein
MLSKRRRAGRRRGFPPALLKGEPYQVGMDLLLKHL